MISRALRLRTPRGPTAMVWARVRASGGGGHSPRKGVWVRFQRVGGQAKPEPHRRKGAEQRELPF